MLARFPGLSVPALPVLYPSSVLATLEPLSSQTEMASLQLG